MQYSNRTETQNLRNELRSYERTENLVVKTQLQVLERDIDQVNQKFRDDMGNLKTNLMIELNEQKVSPLRQPVRTGSSLELFFTFFFSSNRPTSERAARSEIASCWM